MAVDPRRPAPDRPFRSARRRGVWRTWSAQSAHRRAPPRQSAREPARDRARLRARRLCLDHAAARRADDSRHHSRLRCCAPASPRRSLGTFVGNPLSWPFIWVSTYAMGLQIVGLEGVLRPRAPCSATHAAVGSAARSLAAASRCDATLLWPLVAHAGGQLADWACSRPRSSTIFRRNVVRAWRHRRMTRHLRRRPNSSSPDSLFLACVSTMRRLPILRLGVNIDHVATIRNARGGRHPDPVRAAHLARRGRRRRHHRAPARGSPAHLRQRHRAPQGRADAARSISRWRRPRRCSPSRLRHAAQRLLPRAGAARGAHDRGRPRRRRRRRTDSRASCAISRPPASASRCSSSPTAGSDRGARPRSAPTSWNCTPAPTARRRSTDDANGVAGELRPARARGALRPQARASRSMPATGSPSTRSRAVAAHAGDRRAQHRPFPHRRGDLRRPAGRVRRMRALMDEARRGRSSSARGRRDHRHRQRPHRHPPHREDARALRRALHRPHLHRDRARASRSAGAQRAASYAKRFAAKEACAKALGTGLQPWRLLARHGRRQSAFRAPDHEADRREPPGSSRPLRRTAMRPASI